MVAKVFNNLSILENIFDDLKNVILEKYLEKYKIDDLGGRIKI